MLGRTRENVFLFFIILFAWPSLIVGQTTTSPATTTPAPDPGTLLLVKINGVTVNLSNCTWSVANGLDCKSDVLHDLTVTRAIGTSASTEPWVIAMIVVNSILLIVVGGVAIAAYVMRQHRSKGVYDPVPAAPGQAPGYNNYGPPPNPGGGGGVGPAYNPAYPYPPPSGGPPVWTGSQDGAKKVIGVTLVRPSCDDA